MAWRSAIFNLGFLTTGDAAKSPLKIGLSQVQS